MKRSMFNLMFAVTALFGMFVNGISNVQAGLLTNPSFESATIDPNNANDFIGTSANSTDITGWTTTTGINYTQNDAAGLNGPVSTPFGTRFLNLSVQPNSISQSFAVTAGYTYEVSYYEMSRFFAGSTTNQTATIALSAGTATGTGSGLTGSGSSTLSQVASSDKSTTGSPNFIANFAFFTFQFTPNSNGTATLSFANTSSGSSNDGVGTFMDLADVNLVATPEPNGILLFALGSVFLGVVKRRRTR